VKVVFKIPESFYYTPLEDAVLIVLYWNFLTVVGKCVWFVVTRQTL